MSGPARVAKGHVFLCRFTLIHVVNISESECDVTSTERGVQGAHQVGGSLAVIHMEEKSWGREFRRGWRWRLSTGLLENDTHRTWIEF